MTAAFTCLRRHHLVDEVQVQIVVVDEETGLTVPPGHPAPLAAAITRLLGDPSLRMQLGRAGREHVVQAFSDQVQVARTEALYEMGLRRRRNVADSLDAPLAAVGGRQ